MLEVAEFVGQNYGLVLAVAYVLVAGATVLHVLLFKTDSRAAFGWVGLVIVFPLAGSIFYLIFGINRVRRKAQQADSARSPWTEQGSLPEPSAPAPAQMSPLQSIGWRVTGRPPLAGNAVCALMNGEQAFPQMLDVIRTAEREVLLSTYIFDNDATGRSFAEACSEASGRGVDVRILIDDVGRRHSFPSILAPLQRGGAQVRRFMPLRLLPPSLSVNLRNHRKLLLADNSLAFAGGMNIGDRQLARSALRYRACDLHFRFAGPVVPSLRNVFAEDWRDSGGSVLAPLDGDGHPREAGSACRAVADGPDEKLDHLAMLIEGVVSAARERVWIMTPYFLPHKALIGALQSAALRGADVAVVIPARNNWPFVRWALNHNLWELLKCGIRVFERPPPFAHSKCLLIDDDYTLIGSANLDPRSLRLNFELGVEVFGGDLNATLAAHMAEIMGNSHQITRKAVIERGVSVRVRDAISALFSPYL